MKNIDVKISGDRACFTNVHWKGETYSYDIITPSAARNILQSIYWKPQFDYIIKEIRVLKEIKTDYIRTNGIKCGINYKINKEILNGIVRGDNIVQRSMTYLRDVEYVVTVEFKLNGNEYYEKNEILTSEKMTDDERYNKHYGILKRRLLNGQHWKMPYMGIREFPAKVEFIEKRDIPSSVLKGEFSVGRMLYDYDYKKQEPIWFNAVLNDGILKNIQGEN